MKRDDQTGFTLIELMIVIVVISVITVLAISSYINYVERAQKADAENTLLEISLFLERYYTTNGKYEGANISEFTNKYYEITGDLTDKTFTLIATSKKKRSCGTLTIDEKNYKTPEDCW